MTTSELDFKYWIQFYQGVHGENINKEEIVYKAALNSYARHIAGKLPDMTRNANFTADKLTNTNAKEYMLYGVLRRFIMMRVSYLSILKIATLSPFREEPLSSEEEDALMCSLNLIYINIRGILDNFAWCLLHEKYPDIAKEKENNSKGRRSVGLFNASNNQSVELSNCFSEFSSYKPWFQKLSDKRDPAAHRMPLYVVPAVLDKAKNEGNEYRKSWELYSQDSQAMLDVRIEDAQLDEKIEDAQQHINFMRKQGKFMPLFTHHPDPEYIQWLYPTLIEDIAIVIKIFILFLNKLQS